MPTYSRVTSRTISIEGSEPYTYTYDYTGATTNRPGISEAAAGPRPYIEPYTEFRGHSRVIATDPYGAQTFTYFHQDDIYTGRPYQVTIKDKYGKILQVSTTVYDYEQWPAATLITREVRCHNRVRPTLRSTLYSLGEDRL